MTNRIDNRKRETDSRTYDSRAFESREADHAKSYRTDYSMQYTTDLKIPEEVKKDGYVQGWVNFRIGNEMRDKIMKAMDRGWQPVPKSRAPQRSIDILGLNPYSNEYFCIGDLMLMEIEEEKLKAIEQFRNKVTKDKLRACPGLSDANSNHYTSLGEI